MKSRIFGTILMLVVLGGVGYLTGAFESDNTFSNNQPQNQYNDPADSDFKNLKIN